MFLQKRLLMSWHILNEYKDTQEVVCCRDLHLICKVVQVIPTECSDITGHFVLSFFECRNF